MNVVITGASSGIGREVALQLAAQNHEIIAISRNGQKLKELERESNGKINTIEFDLNVFDEYDSLLKKIMSLNLEIDVLINNAGYLVNKEFEEITVKDFDITYNTNIKAPFFLSQRIWPLMKTSEIKSIINIGSIGGMMNTEKFPGLSSYSSSKGALSILTECLATELEPKGGRVNCLALGAVQTDMLKRAFPDYIPDVTPVKMAKFIVSFITQNHTLINGKVLPIANIKV